MVRFQCLLNGDLRLIDQTSQQMGVNIEAELVDEGAFLHGELNLIDEGEVRVRNLVILNYEVSKGNVLATLIMLGVNNSRRGIERRNLATYRHFVRSLPIQNITKPRLGGVEVKVLTEVSHRLDNFRVLLYSGISRLGIHEPF